MHGIQVRQLYKKMEGHVATLQGNIDGLTD